MKRSNDPNDLNDPFWENRIWRNKMREKNKKIDFEGSGVGGSLREINLTDTFDLTDRERLGNLTDTSRRQSIFLKKGVNQYIFLEVASWTLKLLKLLKSREFSLWNFSKFWKASCCSLKTFSICENPSTAIRLRPYFVEWAKNGCKICWRQKLQK